VEYEAVAQQQGASPLMAEGKLENLVGSCWDTQTFVSLASGEFVTLVISTINSPGKKKIMPRAELKRK